MNRSNIFRAIQSLLFCCSLAFAHAQTPADLIGSEYRGTSESEHQEGCEGCGNPGHVSFREDRLLDYTLPGSDIIGSLQYTRKGNRLDILDSDWTMELKGDTLFFTAYDYRHVYVRARDQE